jgi:O-antigen/teichoic acid export membrane protein
LVGLRNGHPVEDSALASSRERAGARALKNVGVRGVAEILGKFSTLVLFAVMARQFGPSELGVFVFALAYLGIVTTPIGVGLDPYTLRTVAADRSLAGQLLLDVIVLKLLIAGPVLTVGIAVLWPLGYGPEARATVAVLSVSLLLDGLARTFHTVFNALERGGLLAMCLIVQRTVTTAAGLVVLIAGGGLVPLAAIFVGGSAVHVGLAVGMTRRHLRLTAGRPAFRDWGGILRHSLPFAALDVANVLLFRLDAVLLSVLAAETAVGRYGAAYRLVDATMFVSWSLTGAFAAMYVSSDRRSELTLGGVFGRSLKLGLILLVPVAAAFGILAEPICVTLFGAEFRAAAEPLRILAPVVVLLAVVALSAWLIVSRGPAGIIARVTLGMVVLNAGLNLALIPRFADRGAALAMLATEVLLAVVVLFMANRVVGGLPWVRVLASPLLAGALMTGVMAALHANPIAALIMGVVVYVVVLTVIESRVSPDDLAFLMRLLRRRLRGRGSAPPVSDRAGRAATSHHGRSRPPWAARHAADDRATSPSEGGISGEVKS